MVFVWSHLCQRRPVLHADAGGAQRHASWSSRSRRSSRCCSACRRSPCRGRRCCSRSGSTSSCRSIVAQLLRRAAARARRPTRRSSGCCARLSPLSLAALLLDARAAVRLPGRADPRAAAGDRLLAVPILIQVYFNSGLAYLLNRAARRGALRRRPFGADRRQQLLRARRRRGDQPVRLAIRRRARDRRRRADRSAGDALGGADREPQPGLVRAPLTTSVNCKTHGC